MNSVWVHWVVACGCLVLSPLGLRAWILFGLVGVDAVSVMAAELLDKELRELGCIFAALGTPGDVKADEAET